MSSSSSHSDPRPRPGVFVRFLVALSGASALAMGVAGCEYFTSGRLDALNPENSPPAKPGADVVSKSGTTVDSEGAEEDQESQMTAAQVVAMMERIIRGNERELDDLEPRVEDQEDLDEARDVFQRLDDMKQSLEREAKKAREAGDATRAEEVDRQAKALQKPWDLARERLDLDLRGRMLSLERMGILRDVLAHDRRRLAAVLATGDLGGFLDQNPAAAKAEVESETAVPAGDATSAPADAEKKADDAPTAASLLIPGLPAAEKKEEPPADADKKADADKSDNAAKDADAKTEAAPKDAAAADAEKKPAATPPPSKELVVAKRVLAARSTTVRKLQERTITLDARMKNLERSLALVGELAEVARKTVENATQTRDYLQEQLAEEKPSAAAQAWTHDGADALGSLSRHVRDAGADEKRYKERLDEMGEERELVVNALRRTTVRAQSERKDLAETQETVEALQSPFSSHNIRLWLRNNAPPILATLTLMTVLYLIITRYSNKLVEIFASRGLRGSKAERDNRTETLVSVLQNTGSLAVLVGGTLTLLNQLGIPVGPLLGGAAVVGVAVAFGAQNLIKDFFYGFMILLENQYKLKDVVKIGDHSGQVEQITLRMTALRDGDGALHFLPNGATTSVVNMTHGWSCATFAVAISWEEDVDRVIAIITDLGRELRQDPKFRLMIVDDLNVWGVDSATNQGVVIQFAIKTLPLQQWAVKREYIKRLKKKFQEKNVLLPPLLLVPPAK